ncbi:hypothetical protein DES53_11523 [Roseimicrobium gellanilyticum]|uniref:Uncharacterized protein n=1 Tax=Roseimicrobium gellanilyticum TaxID=748857 RepID=A0A366H5F7_9BACT|nr:hypothetical protein [Roseimicrobium gellanilyticum]RBP36882.1 hypothetical protein DES53_11523 [Roseimicrobium gellanilyticum]
MKSLSSLFSGALHRRHPSRYDHRYDRMGYLIAGGAGILQAFRARGYHKLVSLALAGSMLYKGLSGRGHAKSHGHGHGHVHGLIPVRTHGHGLGGLLSRRK